MSFDQSTEMLGPPKNLVSSGWEDRDSMESFREARGEGIWGVIISHTETFILVDGEGRIIGDRVNFSTFVDCQDDTYLCWSIAAAIDWDGEKFIVLTLNLETDLFTTTMVDVLLWNVFVE